MNTLRLLPFALLVSLAACSSDVGIVIDEFRPAHEAAGIDTEIVLNRGIIKGSKLHGELLTVTDQDAVLLLDAPLKAAPGQPRFVRVPFAIMRRIRLAQVGGSVVTSEGPAMDEARLDRLRRLARYPQGLTEELTARLLVTYGERDIHVLQKPTPPP